VKDHDLRELLRKMCEWESGKRCNLDESLVYFKKKFKKGILEVESKFQLSG
jgi:hypothetical protein